MALVFHNVTDPFAMDFGLETFALEYNINMELASYFNENMFFFTHEGNQVDGSHIPSDSDSFIVSPEVGAAAVPYIVSMIISIVLSLVLNLVFAPEELDLSDERPTYNTYLWGRGATKSEAMIAVPIVLGQFPVYGNLIATISETQTISQGTRTLYDNINLLYGLSSNPLESIEQVNLDNIEAKNFEDDDLALFYTLGDIKQGPMRAFQDKKEENGDIPPGVLYDSESKVHRYNWNGGTEYLNNEPLSLSEMLFKEFRIENYPATILERATHFAKDAVLSFEKQGEFNGSVTFLGVCDSTGTLRANPELLPNDIPEPGVTDVYILVKNQEITIEQTTIDCENTTSYYYDKYCGLYESMVTDRYVPIKDEQKGSTVFPSGSYVLLMRGREMFDPTLYGVGGEEYAASLGYAYEDTLYLYKTLDIGADTSVLRLKSRSKAYVPIEVGRLCVKAEVIPSSVVLVDAKFDAEHTTPGSPVSYSTTSTFGLEDIRLNLVAASGFFWRRPRRSNPVAYGEVWVSFGYNIIQKKNGVDFASFSLMPKKLNETNRPPTNFDATNKNPMYFTGEYLESVAFDISIAEVVNFNENFSDIENFQGVKKVIGLESKPLLTVDEKGYLPARDEYGHPYSYTISIAQYSHGIKSNREGYVVDYQDPDERNDNKQEALTINLKLHRITEINFDETITYPGISLLGMSLNATEALNNSLPNIQVIARGKFRIWEEGYDKFAVSTWPEGFSNNPAFICLSLLYDTFYGAGLGGTSLFIGKDTSFALLVDIPKFLEFADYCNNLIHINGITPPVKRHLCNGVIDDKLTLWSAIGKVLKSVDAVPVLLGNKLSMNYEKDLGDVLVPVEIFSSSNIIKGSFTESFQDINEYTKSVTTQFYDEDNYYEQTAANLNLSLEESPNDTGKVVTVDSFGMTNVNRVYQKLKKAIRSANLGKRIYSFKTTSTGMNLLIGDNIGVNYEMVDWGLQESPGDDPLIHHSFSGRVVEVDALNKRIVLDTVFPVRDGIVYRVLLKSMKSDKYDEYSVISHTVDNGRTEVRVTTNNNLPIYKPGDIFMLGAEVELYKDVIILEVTVDKNNTTSIKAYEYFSELFDLGDYLITDFGNLHFNKDSLAPQNLTATPQNYTVVLTWSPPAFLDPISANHYESSSNKNIEVHKYIIYRKSYSVANDPTHYKALDWEQIGEVGPNSTSFTDYISSFSIDYEYQVRPLYIYKKRVVAIPRSWCDRVRVLYSFVQDFLPFPVVRDFACMDSETLGYQDIKLEIVPSAPFTLSVDDEWFAAYVVQNEINDTSWLGPQDIYITQALEPDDEYIYVNSLNGLPTDYNTGQVKGLFAIGDDEVVFIEGSDSITKRLKVSNAKGLYPSAFNIDYSHEVGEPFTSRHHGFFPVRVFATQLDNGMHSGLDLTTSTADSIFVYYKEGNYIRTHYPEDLEIVENLPLWDFQLKQINDQYGWRLVSGTDRAVVYMKGAKVATTNDTSADKFFIFEHGELPGQPLDISIGTGYQTQDYRRITPYLICRDKNSKGVVPATMDASGNLKVHIERVALDGEYYWVGIQYAKIFGDYGFTSHIKVV